MANFQSTAIRDIFFVVPYNVGFRYRTSRPITRASLPPKDTLAEGLEHSARLKAFSVRCEEVTDEAAAVLGGFLRPADHIHTLTVETTSASTGRPQGGGR